MMYDELIYHLDLCILSYQLHAQTLIWPMDPYYEQLLNKKSPNLKGLRDAFMAQVKKKFSTPALNSSNQATFHGPGYCAADPSSNQGWLTNMFLDPIISDYSRINPWRPSFTRPYRGEEPWIVYDSPGEITNPIDKVYMIHFDRQKGPDHKPPDVHKQTLFTARPTSAPQTVRATDLLYGFEGGTGAVGGDDSQKKYPSWSMMGFVLARKVSHAEMYPNPQKKAPTTAPPEPYDVHIVFRGSRSGDPRLPKAKGGEGNPDWVTDLQLTDVVPDPEVSKYGSVCKGFSASLKSILPTVIESLVDIHRTFQAPPAPPRTIYVTGHSLGGALASHFASAMMLGNKYGPAGTGDEMPDQLRAWPWRGIQVITYSSPAVGGDEFHQAFNKTVASRRIWLDGDPIVEKTKLIRHHVGIPYCIPSTLKGKVYPAMTPYHDPRKVRWYLVEHRKDDGFPDTGVPAQEPWQLFKTCNEMLTHLGQLVKKSGYPECFPKFAEHLQKQFEILEASLQGRNNSAGAQIRALNAALGTMPQAPSWWGAAQYTSLENQWKASKQDVEGFDVDLHKYVGLCLALAFRGMTTVPMAPVGAFADLLKTI